MVDTSRYMKMWNSLVGTGGSHYPSSHISGIVKLQQGQKVWVKNSGQTEISGTDPSDGLLYTWFSGYLLFPDN